VATEDLDVPGYSVLAHGYAERRMQDRRLAALIDGSLDDASTVVNVGAGAGNYESTSRWVVSVEPSAEMLAQRHDEGRRVVRAVAARLPIRDDGVAAALAIMTVHHWPDVPIGLAEMRRVARDRVVVFTWDPDYAGFWLDEYLPELTPLNRRRFPPIRALATPTSTVEVVPIPHDCSDGFVGAYWRRPEALFDVRVQRATSGLASLPAAIIGRGLQRLADDLKTGRWRARHAQLLDLDTLDVGYRLVVDELAGRPRVGLGGAGS
jgi:SAM-dependent methyltransferase